jgi:hypothetical protein
MVPVEQTPPHPPSFRRCVCVLHDDIVQNVERGMKGLSDARTVKESPLYGKHDQNLVITASSKWVRRHLRYVAVRRPPTWFFKVVSDADLVTAWLSSTAIKGIDIFDADAFAVSTEYLSIPDLVVPPDLLVIRMGIKAARNSASPEVLAETLNIRRHKDLPTWIWDDPSHPLGPGHMFWSDGVEGALVGYEQVKSSPDQGPRGGGKGSKREGAPRLGTGQRKSLRGGGE